MMNNTIAFTTTANSIAHDTIAINIDVGDTVIQNLCSDFTPYITDKTCAKVLFSSSQATDFMTINKTKMILKPTSYDLACYYKTLQTGYEENMYQCFPKTYQFTVSALSLDNNSWLIKEKAYSITVKNISLSKTDTLILGGLMFGTLSICLIGCYLVEKKKALCFCQRRQVTQAPEPEEMQIYTEGSAVSSCPTTA